MMHTPIPGVMNDGGSCMKCIATYPLYQEANERQLDLLAADVDALVVYVPNGVEQVYLGALPIYALIVPDEQVDPAIEIIRLVADENHRSLYRCPKCDSNEVKERPLDKGRWLAPKYSVCNGICERLEMQFFG